jgi:hypothetical protein
MQKVIRHIDVVPSAKIVSNARDDFPEPESPVIAVMVPRGISTSIFFNDYVFVLLLFIMIIYSSN